MKRNTMGMHPEHSDNRLAYVFGFVGALYQWYLNIHLPVDIWSKLIEGVLTAGLCGFAGMVGKEIFKLIKVYMIGYFRKRKK